VPAHCDIQQGGRLAARAGACAPRLACGPCGEALPVSCPCRRWMRGAAVRTDEAEIRSAYSLFDSICLLPPSHVAAVPGVRQPASLFAALALPGVAARWPSSWGGPAWRSPRLVTARSGGGRQARSRGGQAAACRSRRACGAVRLLRPGPHLLRRVVQSAPGPRRSSPPTAPRGSGAVGGAAPIRQWSSWGAAPMLRCVRSPGELPDKFPRHPVHPFPAFFFLSVPVRTLASTSPPSLLLFLEVSNMPCRSGASCYLSAPYTTDLESLCVYLIPGYVLLFQVQR
jgi:hypothetical protein